jgi:uncharacterized protein
MQTGKFLEIVSTESVLQAQEHYYGNARCPRTAAVQDALTEEEVSFIKARDSFYMATITETGWPYVQHRGGERGFLHVISPTVLVFADYQGNRQMLSTGNLAKNDRVALFLMDYPHRERLKILGHARVEDARQHPGLLAQVAKPDRNIERLFTVQVIGFDWNCPKYITPRYAVDEMQDLIEPLQRRIAELESILKAEKA